MSAKSGGKSRTSAAFWLGILIFLLLLCAASYGGWQFYLQKHSVEEMQNRERRIATPVFMPLDTFTVNLLNQDNNLDRVLYIGITLRLPDEETRRHMNDYLPEIRSRLLMLFSRQHAEALADAQGKQQLIQDIKATLAPPLVAGRPNQVVSDVLFTAFILR